MTDKKMTPEQLVKDWLPDCLRKWTHFYLWEILPCRPMFLTDKKIKRRFVERYFPEALESFAAHYWEQACKAQRVVCEERASVAMDENEFDPGQAIMDALSAILTAPTPEFKLIKKE